MALGRLIARAFSNSATAAAGGGGTPIAAPSKGASGDRMGFWAKLKNMSPNEFCLASICAYVVTGAYYLESKHYKDELALLFPYFSDLKKSPQGQGPRGLL